MPVNLICENCGKSYKQRESRIERSKFCSRSCSADGRSKRKLKDLVGKKFGKYTVVKYIGEYGKRDLWLCHCECGNEKSVRTDHLITGNTLSCGCHRSSSINKLVPGSRFGRLVIIKFDKMINYDSTFICQCDCGKVKTVLGKSLKKGATKSCGCYQKEVIAERAKRIFTTHGLSKERWYLNWLKKKRISPEWTLEMQKFLFEVQPRCIICNSDSRLETDHVIPFSKGGTLKPGNVVVLCRSCNSRKHDLSLDKLPRGWKTKIVKTANNFLRAWKNR